MPEPRPIRVLASTTAAKAIGLELSRRRFLSFAAVAGATTFLAACAPGGGAGPAPQATGGALEGDLSIYTWGDYDAPEVIEAFTTSLGPAVTLDSYSSNEEMIAKLVAAKGTSGYDIIVPTGVFIPQLVENKLIQPLQHDLIPNLKHVDPQYLALAWDPENEYSICKNWGTNGFVYDKTVITRELTTWADFIDAAQNEASGKTSMLDDPVGITGVYFWSNGIDWTTTDAADLDAAEAFVVNDLAPHIVAFDSYPSTAMIQGSRVLMQSWNGEARLGIIESGEPDRWQWVLGAPDTELWMDNWAIAAGAPHPEAAHAFINYVLAPENSLAELDYIGYHTGGLDIEQTAIDSGVEMPELIFFTPEQVATMHEGAVNEAQGRIVDIWNKAKAAAGA
ncbi:MAG TPA: spermidine/putrescine ABC transporter substrate-binding protein [Microbacterium sp.]|uniref:polyamine ABC transporter substrate-binding protein n=1 Tax=Microbacterium sp. TaxID=51671 RepID=UPI002D1DE5F1|nr:spermidine/putrescine ABC transporter substrate-binding protein [Microbacterium sp.]HWI30632.1 spermidine/putrescine ABC transporter substrate-binding protein [Microbacterium sp.]